MGADEKGALLDVALDYNSAEDLTLVQASDRSIKLYQATDLSFVAESYVAKVGSIVLQALFAQDWRKHAAKYETEQNEENQKQKSSVAVVTLSLDVA